MNTNRYRLVFNRARGVCMAVIWGFVLMPALQSPAWAQSTKPIQADPNAPANLRPGIGQAANGVPLINIQKPSAAGVSRNLYQQFDLQSPGAILNNSRANTPTLLGGWVQGNPNLGQGSARIILNEVNSNQPSLLQGHLETAGPAAQVIIANPAGIHCNGCGFINASRATLTTGNPLLANGQLQGYRVQGGSVTLSGAGLDTSTTPYTDIIARALNLNASLWAQNLAITTGPNTFSLDPAVQPTLAAPSSASPSAPSYAIDSSALGGMYAGRITIIATEAGVGVRHAGKAYATAADLTLHSAGPIHNSGELIGQIQLQLNTPNSLINTGTLSAPQLHINAQNLTNQGSGAQILANNATLFIQNTLDNLSGANIRAQRLAIQAQTLNNHGLNNQDLNNQDLNNQDRTQAPIIAARQRLDLGVRTLTNLNHALIYSEGDLAIGGSLEPNPNTLNTALNITPSTTGQATQITNHGATLQALGNLSLNTQALHNTNANLATVQQRLFQENITEYQAAGSPKRYTPGTPGVAIYNDESDHLQTPEGNFSDWTAYTYTRSTDQTQITQSQPGQIISGGNLTLNADTAHNDNSILMAGAGLKNTVSGNPSGNLSGNIGTLTNTEQTIERTVTDSGTSTSYWRHHRRGRDKTGSSTAAYTPAPTTQAIRPDSTTGTPTGAINSTADQSAAHLAALNTPGPIPIAPDTQALALQSPSIQHLIETDPAFTQYRNWLAADPLLRSLKLDNPQLQNYLSEAIRKHQLSFEQITLLARALKAQSGDPTAQDEDEPAKLKSRAKKAAQAAAPSVAQTVAQPAPAAPPAAAQTPSGLVVGGQAGGLIAGNTINLNIGQTLNNSGTILAQNTLALNTNNLHNHGGNINASTVNLNAAQDLTSSGTLAATQSLQASAGRDLTLASTTQSTRASNTNTPNTRTHIHQQASVRVGNTAGNGSGNATNTNTTTNTTVTLPTTLSLQAGRDLNLNAANLTNQTTGATALTAQVNINLGTVDQTQTTQIHWDANNQRSEHRQTAQGSILQTQSNLSLQAGQDLNAQAATLNSQTGTLQAQAGRNLALQAAQQRTQIDERHQHQGKSGLLAKTTTTRRDTLEQTTAQGSTLSAATINLQAAQNLTLQGSQVVSDQATALQAGNTLNITTAAQTQHQSQQRNTKKTGIFSGGGISLTAGTQAQSLDQTTTTQTAAPSTVGSLQGKTTLQASQAYQQQGGDILSPQGSIRIAAPSIAITEAREHSTQTTQHQFKQSGITVGLSNPVLTAIDTIQQQKDAAKEAQDPRLKALAAANIALAAREAMKAVTGGKDATGGNSARPVGGLNLSLSVGKSSSQSHSTVEQDTAQGASLQADGDVQLLAGTEPAQTPNTTPAAPLTLQGSTVRAGRNLQLSTPGTITAQAAPNTRSQRSTNSSKSGSVGGSIGTDGLLFTASASRGQGKANGFEATWTNTQLQAGQTLNFQSGGNTTLQGAVASAPGISAQVGGNLALQSLQDTETYQSQQRSVGGSLAVGAGRGSGSLSSNKADIQSDYRSVQDQTRLEAGDAGFDIQVQGNTSLTGAAITSTESAVRGVGSRFNTGSLSTQDLSNSAQYQGKAVGIAFGVGQNSTSSSNTKNASTGAQLNGVGMGKVQGNTSSTTQSAITGVLEPSTSLALHTPLHKTTDFKQLENQLQAQVNITQKFAQEASRTVQRYSDKQRQALQQQLKTNTQGLSKEQQEQREQTIRQRISTLNTEERVLNILIGAVTGTSGAAVSQAALSQAADQMRQLMDVDSKKFAGVTDGITVLGNMTGDSAGVRGDGLKIGGTRVDLDLLCGRNNERCLTKNGQLELSSEGRVVFKPEAAGVKTVQEFIENHPDGKQMIGITGGIQGMKGTLFGRSYDEGSWQDHLIEAFSGSHDMIGGQLSGLYDEQGNARRGRSVVTKVLHNRWSEVAIPIAAPFAAAEFLPPQVWQAIGILLKGGQ